jgi:hypothetical protein
MVLLVTTKIFDAMPQHDELKFEKLQYQILEAVNSKINQGILENMRGFYLIDGFVELEAKNVVGAIYKTKGTSMPLVSFLNPQTGELRLFAVKSLLPYLTI